MEMSKFLNPSLFKLSTAVLVGYSNKSEIRSVKILFISSGIDILKDRNPASTCATFICNFLAAKAPAIV